MYSTPQHGIFSACSVTFVCMLSALLCDGDMTAKASESSLADYNPCMESSYYA